MIVAKPNGESQPKSHVHGVCFRLTVDEHLWFYGQLKGMSAADIKVEMEKMIIDVGLPHKRQELSKNLSGQYDKQINIVGNP